MTPDLIALMVSVNELLPRERALLAALGDADPDMLTLSAIADGYGAHVSGFAIAAASLRSRGFVALVDGTEAGWGTRPAPLYRLLKRGRAAVHELQHDRAHRARRWQPPARSRIGSAA